MIHYHFASGDTINNHVQIVKAGQPNQEIVEPSQPNQMSTYATHNYYSADAKQQRIQKLANLIKAGTVKTVEAAAADLKVSVPTVQRYLHHLNCQLPHVDDSLATKTP